MKEMSSIADAIEAIREGKIVIVVDDEDRENEGDLIVAAEKITEEQMALFIRHTSGIVFLSLSNEIADLLELPPMVAMNTSKRETPFTITIEAAQGVTTGVSAKDRVTTIKAAINPVAIAADLSRPGHIFPLRAKDGGVLERAGHTEASVDLAKLAGLRAGAVGGELMNDDGTMMRMPELQEFAKKHDMLLISVADIIAYRRTTETFVRRDIEKEITNEFGTWNMIVYKDVLHDCEHVALVLDEINPDTDTLVRVHSERIADDVFGSSAGVKIAMQKIAEQGSGVMLYLRHQCRSQSLADQMKQVDTTDDTEEKMHIKEYGIGAQILQDLQIRTIRLLTNHPRKLIGLDGYDLHIVEQIGLEKE